jgi:hypothetical protein
MNSESSVRYLLITDEKCAISPLIDDPDSESTSEEAILLDGRL